MCTGGVDKGDWRRQTEKSEKTECQYLEVDEPVVIKILDWKIQNWTKIKIFSIFNLHILLSYYDNVNAKCILKL